VYESSKTEEEARPWDASVTSASLTPNRGAGRRTCDIEGYIGLQSKRPKRGQQHPGKPVILFDSLEF
jgi:hypothetical protein